MLVSKLIERYIQSSDNNKYEWRDVMVGDLIEVFIFMLIIGGLAFAPLGYFIYMYTMKDGEPFGDTEPHGDSDSLVLDLAEKAINMVKGLIVKK